MTERMSRPEKRSVPLKNRTALMLGIATAAALGAVEQSQAATLYWDANGATTGTGGTGNWNTADSTWRNGSATGTLQAWANNNLVNLGGTAGTVTLTENITAGTGTGDIMGVGVSGYTISNTEGSTSSGKSLTFDGTGGSGNYRIGLNSSANNLSINAPVVLTGYTIGIRAGGTGGTVTINGDISGDRGLNTHRSGGTAQSWTLVLNGNNSFTGVAGDYSFHGGVYHSEGTLVVGHDNALGTGNLYWGVGAKLQAGNGNRTVANTLRFGNDPNVEFTGANNLTFTTDVPYFASAAGGGAKFTVTDSAATLTFGNLRESAAHAAGPFEKLGAGTLAITGRFGCGGNVTVTAGTLLLNGPTGDMTALGPPATYIGQKNYTVASAGTLGGAGTINLASGNSVTVNGKLAPGNSAVAAGVGTLTVSGGNGVIFAGSSTLEIQLTGDSIDVLSTGALDLASSSDNLVINASGTHTQSRYVFATYTGSLSNNTFDNVTINGLTGATIDYATAGEIAVVVPEPTSAAGLLAAGALMAIRRRQRA